VNVIVIIATFICVVSLSAIFSLLYRGVDRKLVAHMQGRVGPPVIQPFRDVRKLLMKENIIPDGAISGCSRQPHLFV